MAENLYKLGEKEDAINALLKVLEIPEDKARCHALNTIVYIGDDGQIVRDAVTRLYTEKQYKYSWRIVDWLIDKWNIEAVHNE